VTRDDVITGGPPVPYGGPVSRPLLFLDVDFTDRG
jgi:hypothetical protein